MSEEKKKNTYFKVINDPIHGVMSLPEKYGEILKYFIDHHLFQRLRHIKQLGLAELVYPGATHNRFSHSLGACYLAYKIIKKLEPSLDEQKVFKGSDEKEKFIKNTLIAALLHDIGHGPFSHVFEKLLKIEDQKDLSITHEDWTLEIIDQGFDECHHLDKKDKEIIKKIIEGKNFEGDQEYYNLASDIVSSQLDADRMDFLLRDSHFCGVTYGHFEVDWIINSAVLLEKVDGYRLGFSRKGCVAIEHFLFARRYMYQIVAQHRKILIFEELLVKFLKALRKNNGFLERIQNNRLKEFLESSESYLKKELKLARRDFIREYYHHYIHLTDLDIWQIIHQFAKEGSTDEIEKIAWRIANRQSPEYVRVEKSIHSGLSKRIKEYRTENEIEDYQLFFVEEEVKTYISKDKKEILIKEDGVPRSITKDLHLISLVENNSEQDYYLVIDQCLLRKEKLKKILGEFGLKLPEPEMKLKTTNYFLLKKKLKHIFLKIIRIF